MQVLVFLLKSIILYAFNFFDKRWPLHGGPRASILRFELKVYRHNVAQV